MKNKLKKEAHFILLNGWIYIYVCVYVHAYKLNSVDTDKTERYHTLLLRRKTPTKILLFKYIVNRKTYHRIIIAKSHYVFDDKTKILWGHSRFLENLFFGLVKTESNSSEEKERIHKNVCTMDILFEKREKNKINFVMFCCCCCWKEIKMCKTTRKYCDKMKAATKIVVYQKILNNFQRNEQKDVAAHTFWVINLASITQNSCKWK